MRKWWEYVTVSVQIIKSVLLKTLYCDGNSLGALDVSANTALENLLCESNSLSALDVSSCPVLCGYVKNIGREGQEKHIVALKDLADEPIDMFTTVFIGNKETKIYGDNIVTPRGYEKKEL